MKDKVINDLLKRISDLEFEVEKQEQRIDKAIEYIMTELISEWNIKNDGYVSGSDLPANAITPILDILKGVDKV